MEYFILFVIYAVVGLVIEVTYTALDGLWDLKISGDDRRLEGKTYLWMIPVYGLTLPFLFHPLVRYFGEAGLPMAGRFLFWAISFSAFEALFGWFYDKTLGFCPWDYSRSKWKVFERGYTKWTMLPLWGACGLMLEPFARYLQAVLPTLEARL